MALSRNRIGDARNGGLSDGEVQDAITVAAPLRLTVPTAALKEQVNEAITNYSVAFALASANAASLDRQRARLQRTVSNLLEIALEAKTRDLVELLRFHPVTMRMLDRPIAERFGSLPLAELIQNLQEFSDALENRVFPDDLTLADNKERPAFHALIGALWETFDASFVETDRVKKEARFDVFARKVLQAAGVKPVNGASFADNAIKDALRSYRRSTPQS